MSNAMSLKSIKRESVKSIFNTITTGEQISRAEISEKTGLSLVTVGKVADALLDMHVLVQEKQIKATAGRRAGLLTINTNKFVLLLDVSSRVFRHCVLDLNLNLVEKTQYAYMNDRFYEENIRMFFQQCSLHMQNNYDMDECFGIGVSLPGIYDESTDLVTTSRIPEIKQLHIKSMVKEYFSDYPVYLDASENVAALSNITIIPEYNQKSILYWFMGEENTTGAFVVNGQFIQGYHRHPCDFGNMVLPGGNHLGSALRSCKTIEDMVELIQYPLHMIIQMIAPHCIILENERFKEEKDRMTNMIRESLHTNYKYPLYTLPEFYLTGCKFRHAHRGLAMILRSMWIDQVLIDN